MNINKIKVYYQKYGVFYLFKKAMKRIGSLLFLYIRLNFYCVSSVPSTQIQPKCPLKIRKGNFDDIELIVNFAENGNKKKVYEQTRYFLNKGGEMFLAFSEGRLAHIARLYYYPGVLEVSPLESSPLVKLKEDEVYIGFCETNREFRGKNIYPAVLQYIVRYALENNKKKCFVSTIPSNIASIRGMEKAGFSLVGQKRKFRLFGKIFNNLWSSSDIIWP
ncbi:MAG: GNAT family N-acetyltransferase [Sedimentisphaerales bacterium]|jgi:RimJ/RimL family protein N-acetyltransferase